MRLLRPLTARYPAIGLIPVAALVWLIAAPAVSAAEPVPRATREALSPVTQMIATLVAIAIGLGIAVCTAVIVWGAVEKMLAGPSSEAEHRAQRRISNGIMGLIWMVVASVVVSVITAIAVAYGLIDRPF